MVVVDDVDLHLLDVVDADDDRVERISLAFLRRPNSIFSVMRLVEANEKNYYFLKNKRFHTY